MEEMAFLLDTDGMKGILREGDRDLVGRGRGWGIGGGSGL